MATVHVSMRHHGLETGQKMQNISNMNQKADDIITSRMTLIGNEVNKQITFISIFQNKLGIQEQCLYVLHRDCFEREVC